MQLLETLTTTTTIQPWNLLINLILQKYVFHASTICLIWHNQFDIKLKEFPFYKNAGKNNDVEENVFLHINMENILNSLENNVYNFNNKKTWLENHQVVYDEFIEKLTVSIEFSHCEFFIVFQEDIPLFARAFYNASIYSIWRSMRTRFLFVYSLDLQKTPTYFNEYLFHDQANILILEMNTLNSTSINLKTNRFVGSLYNEPNTTILIDIFDANTNTFKLNADLYADKLHDLQGREIILGAFDYRPFVAIDFNLLPQVYDHAEDNPQKSVHIDGTEVRVLITFCELYNCTVQTDTSEKREWGAALPNVTSNGLIGMIIDRKIHMGLCAMYFWYVDYQFLDMTTFLGRSGVTCMVPKPKQLTSWNLPLKPFQFTLWLGVCGCLCLEILALLLAHQFEGKLLNKHETWLNNFQFGYIVTLKLFVSQGTDYVVNSVTMRTVLVACYMIDMIVTSIYSGGLAAILTRPELAEAADSVDRLYKFGIEWAGTDLVWTEAIRRDEDPIRQTLHKRFRSYSVDELIQKALTDNMGFVVERLTYNHFGNVDPITPESIKRLKIMEDDIYYQWTVGFVPRLWAFLPKYNKMIYNIHTSGFSKYWEWQKTAFYLNGNIQQQMAKSDDGDTGVAKLDMANFMGLIIIWLIGIMTSILAFIYELLNRKYLKY